MSDDPYGGALAGPTFRPGMNPTDIRDPNAPTRPLPPTPTSMFPQTGITTSGPTFSVTPR